MSTTPAGAQEARPCPPYCHEVTEPAISNRAVEEVTREEMAAHSPDGRTPDTESRFRGRTVLGIILLIGLPAVFFGVIRWGGVPALMLSLVYLGLLAGVTFPVWYAGLMRKTEETEAREIVKHVLVENQQRHNPV